ncbi:MAG: FAD-dependent oxidoreductase [Vicinamibacterales bacterium]
MPPSLTRDPGALATGRFDLLVVGGGIYGLTTACDAAQRGLQVALVERNDFGSGTSFNHLRTIHGGLRYLQTLDLRRARTSVRERRALARIAPWAVARLPFVLPLYPSIMKGTMAMRAGFALDALVAADKNQGVAPEHHLPMGRVLSRADAQAQYPALRRLAITGAAVWSDYVTTDADRLTLAWASQAAAHGAVLANYVEAVALTADGGAVSGAEVIDRISGRTFSIAATCVVNATGGHLNRLLAPHRIEVPLPLLQAVNVVTRLEGPPVAVGGRSASGRNLFLVPWRGRALFGTWESPHTCDAGTLGVREEHLQAFLTELNEAFPAFPLTRADVTLVHRGVVPARVGSKGVPTLDGRELVFVHDGAGLRRALSVAGTKYTTARAVAEGIVDRVFRWIGRTPAPCVSANRALPCVNLTGDALLAHVAAHEMVVTLADAVVRRTPMGALGLPAEADLQRAAAVVGNVLGWSEERQRQEIAVVRRFYES